MAYDHNMMNNYDHFMGSEKKSHMGSQSHMGSSGGPSSHPSFGGGSVGGTGAVEHDPGGATAGRVGKGSATKNPIDDDR